MRVALVHDDLVQWGGAERVLLGLSEIYPNAPIFTSVFDEDNATLQHMFGSKKIITSFLQKIPGWKSLSRSDKLVLYKALLPFYPIAFEQFDFTNYDLIISHTTRFAKCIITKPKTLHICYCHTPPRFLWHFSGEGDYGLAELLMTKLRLYDQISARRVDSFLASSQNAKKRIRRVYGADSKVVYPFVDLERFKNVETFDGGYFVVLGRPSRYKRFDLAKAACDGLGIPLKIISGDFSDEMVVQILAGCKALIIPGVEDFGVSSLEAQALGKPVIAYMDGGALETVKDGETGFFFREQTVESLINTLKEARLDQISPDACKKWASYFSKENFMKNFRQTIARLVYT